MPRIASVSCWRPRSAAPRCVRSGQWSVVSGQWPEKEEVVRGRCCVVSDRRRNCFLTDHWPLNTGHFFPLRLADQNGPGHDPDGNEGQGEYRLDGFLWHGRFPTSEVDRGLRWEGLGKQVAPAPQQPEPPAAPSAGDAENSSAAAVRPLEPTAAACQYGANRTALRSPQTSPDQSWGTPPSRRRGQRGHPLAYGEHLWAAFPGKIRKKHRCNFAYLC